MAMMYILGGKYVETEVSIQPKDNKIAANEAHPNHFQMSLVNTASLDNYI